MSELSRRQFMIMSAAVGGVVAAGAVPASASAETMRARAAASSKKSTRAALSSIPFGFYTYPNPSPTATADDEWTGTAYTWSEQLTRYGTATGQTWKSVDVYSEMDTASDVSYCAYQFLYQGPNGGLTSVGAPWGGTTLTPFQGFPMWTTSGDMTFSTIAAGTNDAVLQKILNDYAAAGFKTVHLRPAYEWNLGSITQKGQPSIGGDPGAYASSGSYDPQTGTGGSPSPFVLGWQHMVTVMREQAASNGQTVYFHWNPAIQGYNIIDLRLAYPGNDYVDYIALDVYDQMWPLDWAGDTSGTPTSLPWNWPGYSSQALPSCVDIPWTGFAGQANGAALANTSVAAWANNTDNLYHYLDFPQAGSGNEISESGSLLLGSALGSALSWGVLDHIVWAYQCQKPISFPEVGNIIDLAAVGQPGGIDNTGQWIWVKTPSGGGGVAPLNKNGSAFPGYLASRIAWAESIGVSTGLVVPFVAPYGYNTQTFDWLGWAPAVGTSWLDAFAASCTARKPGRGRAAA